MNTLQYSAMGLHDIKGKGNFHCFSVGVSESDEGYSGTMAARIKLLA